MENPEPAAGVQGWGRLETYAARQYFESTLFQKKKKKKTVMKKKKKKKKQDSSRIKEQQVPRQQK
jgi:hypothetical protein